MASDNCTSKLYGIKEIHQSIFIVLFSLLSIVGSVCNLTILYLFATHRSLRRASKKLLVTLIVGDSAVAFLLGPINITQITSAPQNQICALNAIERILMGLVIISAVARVCIAYDQYIRIVNYSRYHDIMTTKKIYLLMALPWFSPIPVIIAGLVDPILSSLTKIGCVLVVYVLAIFNYSQLVRKLQEINASSFSEVVTQRIRERNRKAIVFISWLMFFAVLCSIQIVIINILSSINILSPSYLWSGYTKDKSYFTAISHAILILNSCINPILYFHKNQPFRVALRQFLFRHEVAVINTVRVANNVNIP